MELEIEKFSPTKAELTKLVEAAKVLTLPDPSDTVQLRKIKDARLTIRDARVAITKTGKTLREDALKFQKAVIAKEKELVGIIEPEETRLSDLEAVAEKEIERKERLELLPNRRERLAAIADSVEVSDDELLEMDGTAFENYFNVRVANKNEADRQRVEAENLKNKEAAAKLDREKEMRDREEKARQEERERLERESHAKQERDESQRKEAAMFEQQEKERLEKQERYRAFLSKNGYTESTKGDFHIERSESEVRLYKLVGAMKIK
jgi:hypothetical protein